MDLQKPIIEQIRNSIPAVPFVATNAMQSGTDVAKSAFTSLADTATNVRASLDDFGQNVGEGATSITEPGNFFDINGLFAKIAFLIFVLFGFVFLVRVGISLVGYFTLPSQSPYIVKGMLNGSSALDISQDPSNPASVPIPRSNDAAKGAEFTWSTWLFVGNQSSGSYKAVFVKGDGGFDATTGINVCNGPGMYLKTDGGGVTSLRICIDTIRKPIATSTSTVATSIVATTTAEGDGGPDVIDISNIPQRKWVHVAVRLQNTLVDTYVNGVISKRTTLSAAPKQNYYDVHVCPNGGFSGSLSDLRYFDHALSVFSINNIVIFGPNTKTTAMTTDAKAVGGNYSYLSPQWYN